MAGGKRTNVQPGQTPSSRAKQKATTANACDINDLYSLDIEKKVDCLRMMDRVQWNQTITGQMDNKDATDSLQIWG